MAVTQLATRIDGAVKRAITAVCRDRGWKIARFVEEALLDKLEELEDAEEIARLRRESARPFSEFVAELKRRGRL